MRHVLVHGLLSEGQKRSMWVTKRVKKRHIRRDVHAFVNYLFFSWAPAWHVCFQVAQCISNNLLEYRRVSVSNRTFELYVSKTTKPRLLKCVKPCILPALCAYVSTQEIVFYDHFTFPNCAAFESSERMLPIATCCGKSLLNVADGLVHYYLGL